MFGIIKKFFSPIPFPDDLEKDQRSRVLHTYWISIWLLVGLNIIGLVFIYEKKTAVSVLVILFVLSLLIVRYLNRQGRIRLGSILLVISMWAVYTVVVILTGTIRTTIVAMPIAIIAMVIPLLGLKAGMISAVCTLLVTLVITLFELTGNPLPRYFPGAPLQNWFHLITAFTIIIVPLSQVWDNTARALRRAKRAELSISEEKEFTDYALNSLKDVVFVFDPATKKSIRWNNTINDLTGYTDSEMENLKTPDDFIAKNDLKKAEDAIQKVIAGDFVTVELHLMTKDGQNIPLEITASAIKDENGLAQYIITIGRDIRERKDTENALRKSENKHRLLFEGANDGIFIIKDGFFTDCNIKILEMFGENREDIIGKSPADFSPEFQTNGKKTEKMAQERLGAALTGEHQFFEWRHFHHDGTEFDVEISLSLLELGDEKFIQAIVRDITERKQAEKDIAEAYETTLEGWANALELRDKETKNHSKRVTELTVKLAHALDVEGESLVQIRRGAILHDIGKMGIPDEILQKPGKLTPAERKVIELHPQYSYDLLSKIPFLKDTLDIPYSHHEHWDGSGYPLGLAGEDIPFSARIFAIVDVWDAVQSERPYKRAWSKEDAIELIQENEGKHFDPKITKVFLALVSQGDI